MAAQVRAAAEHRNEVVLAGRLSAGATSKALPSGDEIVTWRLVVDRPATERGTVDVVECTAFRARVRRQALGWQVDDLIEVNGALRRRFWRGPAGLQSRYEIAVDTAARRGSGVRRPRKSG
jgi:single-strand DNA-binding protein